MSDLRPDPRACKHLDLGVERNLGIRWVTCGECLQAFYPDWTLREGTHEAVSLWLIAEARYYAEALNHGEASHFHGPFPWEPGAEMYAWPWDA